MSNSKFYTECIENIATNFDITKDNQIYQKEQLVKFKDNQLIRNIQPEKEKDKDQKINIKEQIEEEKNNEINEKEQLVQEGKNQISQKEKTSKKKNFINFNECHIAICPNGGLIALCKKKGYLDITKGSLINKFIIITNQVPGDYYLIPIDWPYYKQYFILFDFNEKEQLYGICNDASIYKIDIITQRAMLKLTSELLKSETISKAQLYKDGFIALTGEGNFYYIKEIKNPIPDLIINMKTIFNFSNKIEFLIIPDEVSKSKKMELLITNEKGNGVIHIEKEEDGKYYIIPLDSNNSNSPFVYKNISVLQKDKLEPYIIEDANINSNIKNKKIKKEKDIKVLYDNLKIIVAMAISPSKKNIAFYDNRGIVFFFNSTLDLNLEKNPRKKVEINLSKDLEENDMIEHQMVINYSKSFQFLFCGEDTVALYGLRLIFLINKSSNSVIYKITDNGENDALRGKLFAKLIQEIDGIRYLTEEGIFFISKVNKDIYNICDPFSNSITKKLLKAYEYYIDNSASSEKTLRQINNYLPNAINSLQIAAGNIFWTDHGGEEENYDKKELQLFLLKAAQFGKIYLDENEFNYDKFIDNCKDIKVVNNLRNHSSLPRMITFNEYKNMDSKDLIRKLLRNLNFGMAFEICHFLDYSDKKVYQKYAIAKIKKISKNINRTEEENLFETLKFKLQNVPNFSFIKLAKKAFKYHKNVLGMKFLENEKSALSKIPQYIEFKEWHMALGSSENLYDRNVINIVLHKIYVKEKLEKFIQIVSEHPFAKSAVLDFLNECNPESIEKYLILMKNPEDKFFYYLEKYFMVNELKERKSYLNKAKECLKLINNSISPNFDQKFYKTYIESLENNITFKTNPEYNNIITKDNEEILFDISIYDAYKILLKNFKEDKIILFEKYNNKSFGFSQEGINIIKLINFCEDKRFQEMDIFLKKYNNIKKLSLTNLNVTEIYYKYQKYDKAAEYLQNITEVFYVNYKVNMLEYIENYELALEIIISEKKLANIEELVNHILIKKPNLQGKVEELCEKYKVKLQLN